MPNMLKHKESKIYIPSEMKSCCMRALKKIAYPDTHDATSLPEAFARLGIVVNEDEEGDICDMRINLPDFADEDTFDMIMKAIAPCVEDGSYYKAEREDETVLRYDFTGPGTWLEKKEEADELCFVPPEIRDAVRQIMEYAKAHPDGCLAVAGGVPDMDRTDFMHMTNMFNNDWD